MAEASQGDTTLYRKTRVGIVKDIFRLIKHNALDEIKRIIGTLEPEQRINVLNTSIHGFIPLYVAVHDDNFEISLYLLEISLLQGHHEMSESWKNCRHPLVAAIDGGNPKLIMLILRYLPDINDKINGVYPPLMIATLLGKLTAVKIIVTLGAYINPLDIQGRTPLMESVSSSEICSFLLSRGADVLHQDHEGYTALHFAVAINHKESITHLINAGADIRTRSNEGINPLMWASINMNEPTMRYLCQTPTYTTLERIEALEIVNASCLCSQNLTVKRWKHILFMRSLYDLPQNCQISAREVLDVSQESTTEMELENQQDNVLDLAYQSIMVVERILGRNNRIYLQFLLQTALIAKTKNNTEVRQLIDYIEEHCQESSVLFLAVNLPFLKSLFLDISEFSYPSNFFEYGGFVLFKMIAHAVEKMWSLVKNNVYAFPIVVDNRYSELVDTFLYMTSTTKTWIFSQQHVTEFKELVTKVIREDLRVKLHQSLLHRAIKLMNTPPWSTVELIGVLLESGADANCKDYFRRTPLMYAVEHVPKHILSDVLDLLVKYGCHQDCRNNEGFTAMDNTLCDCCIYIPRTPRSLECLAVAVILDKEMEYEGLIPEIIEDIINFHL